VPAKIAIVDDSIPFCLLVQQLLETESCTLDMYHSAHDFFKIPSRIKVYDLIIMDINLPDVDGLAALKSIKSDPATAIIPVLLLSGDSRASTVMDGVKLGAKDYITKPIDPEQLIERVNSLLNES